MTSLDRGFSYGQKNYTFPETYDGTGSKAHSISNNSGPHSNTDAYDKWRPFFGMPNAPIYRNPEDDMPRENYQLPQAYNGSNAHINKILIREILEEERFPTRWMFPFQESSDALDFVWDTTTFSNTLAGLVPEEAVPRMQSFHRESDSATMHRQGTAFILEHGFAATPLGHVHFAANMTQMKNASVETSEFNAVYAGMNWEQYEDPNAKFREQDNRSGADIMRLFQDDIRNWAPIQKSEDGLDSVVSRHEAAFVSRNKIQPDTWVWPSGIKLYTNSTQRDKLFFMSGLKTGEKYDRLSAAMQGMVWWESRSFEVGENMPDVDPMTRPQTIGNFFVVNDTCIDRLDHISKYRTAMADTLIYNEDGDCFSRIVYKDHWQDLGLFDIYNDDQPDDGYYPLSEIGHQYLGPYRTWGRYFTEAKRMNHVLDSLMSKSDAVKREFLQHVVSQVNRHNTIKDGTTTATPMNMGDEDIDNDEEDEKESGVLSGIQNFGPISIMGHMSDLSSLAHETPFDANEAVSSLSAAFKSSSPPPSRAQLRHVVDFLHRIDTVNHTDVLQAYLQDVSSSSSPTQRSLWEDVYTRLGGTLLKVDLEESINSLKNKTGVYKLTAFEQQQQQQSNDEHLRFTADSKSPKWLPFGKDKQLDMHVTRIHTNPHLDAYQASELDFSSASYTLATEHVVLFAIGDEELKYALSHNGQVLLDLPEGTAASRDTTRTALFQYSLTLSHVTARLLQYIERLDEDAIEEPLKNVATDIRKLVNRKHTPTQREGYMLQAARVAQSLPLLHSQQFARKTIRAVQSLILNIYKETSVPADWDRLVRNAALEIIGNLRSPSEPTAADTKIQGVGTAAAVRFLETKYDDHTAIDDETGDVRPDMPRATNEEIAGAMKHVDAMIKLKAKATGTAAAAAAAAGGTSAWNDSYETYNKMYAELYVLAQRHAIAPSVWKAWVKLADGLFARSISTVDKSSISRVAPLLYKLKDVLEKQGPLPDDINQWKWNSVPKEDQFGQWAKDAVNAIDQENQMLDRERTRGMASAHVLNYRKGEFSPYTVSLMNMLATKSLAERKQILYGTTDREKDRNGLAMAIGKERAAGSEYLFLVNYYLYGVAKPETQQLASRFTLAKAKLDSNADEISKLAVHEMVSKEVFTKEQLRSILDELPIENAAFWIWSMDNDVYFPIGGIGFRPLGTYEMASALLMKGGPDGAGRTMYQRPDFQIANNVSQKMIYGSLTWYSRTIVFNKKYLMPVRNVFCRRYLFGNGIKFYDPLDEQDVADYSEKNALNRDIFFVPVPLSYRPSLPVMDVTGSFHPSIGANEETQQATAYPSSRIMREKWRWSHECDPLDSRWDTEKSRPRFNTLCFQGTQLYYSGATNDWTDRVFSKGHWGANEYPGVGEVRNNYAKYILPVNRGTNSIAIESY